jgi:phage N-6-adenine-methyltransferase
MSVHFSRASDEWSTPQALFDLLDLEFDFTLDPCATNENTKCEDYCDAEMDGLSVPWVGHRAFVNPPYSKLKSWLAKCAKERELGALSVALIPSRTDTKAWHDYIWDQTTHCPRPGVEIRFLKGRLKFGAAENSAPFPSALIIFRPFNIFQQP